MTIEKILDLYMEGDERFITTNIFPNCIIDTKKHKVFTTQDICDMLNKECQNEDL